MLTRPADLPTAWSGRHTLSSLTAYGPIAPSNTPGTTNSALAMASGPAIRCVWATQFSVQRAAAGISTVATPATPSRTPTVRAEACRSAKRPPR